MPYRHPNVALSICLSIAITVPHRQQNICTSRSLHFGFTEYLSATFKQRRIAAVLCWTAAEVCQHLLQIIRLTEILHNRSRTYLPTDPCYADNKLATYKSTHYGRGGTWVGFRSVELSSTVLSSLVAQRRRERRGSGHLLLRRGSSIPGRIAHGGNTAQYERLTKVTGLRCKIDVGTYLPTAGPMFDTSPPLLPTYTMDG